jgi:hypothetical protein
MMQHHIEETALEIYNNDIDLALEYLTTYSNMKGKEALEIGDRMIKNLLTIIAIHDGGLPAEHEKYVS